MRESSTSDTEKTPDASEQDTNALVANRETPPEQPPYYALGISNSAKEDSPKHPIQDSVKNDVISDKLASANGEDTTNTESTIVNGANHSAGQPKGVAETSGNGSAKKISLKLNQDPPVEIKPKFQDGDKPPLVAVEQDGRHSTVKVILEGLPFYPVRKARRKSLDGTLLPLGQDGNQYYCQVCGEFGNVVCCDGCPRVYHQECVPLGSPPRKSLDNDDDPWYCPECIGKKGRRQSRRASEKGDRRSSMQRCVDCQENRGDLSLKPCGECGNYVHFPSCVEDSNDSERVLCSTCRAVDALTKEEDDIHESTERSLDAAGAMESEGSGDVEKDEVNEVDASPTGDKNVNRDGMGAKKRGRPKRKRASSLSVDVDGSDKKSKKKKKDKKTKRKRSRADSISEELPSRQVSEVSLVNELSPQARRRAVGLAQATPAFYFYLGENRWKIERVLARKHRTFNRLPKGDERNELVAKEAALWWVKLRPTDHRRYMNMSMRDFENSILEWKEGKNLQDLMIAPENEGEVDIVADEPSGDVSVEDERLMLERHERLYLGTSVGSKPFKPEPDESYNRVLLDLLHDARFHPLPMFNAQRNEADVPSEEQNSKITIPYFDVHGPISTSVGDECVGCARGWTHYCPVLQRRIPFIEHRAKLQPPLSSLMATRVGLGLRPRLERTETPEQVENGGVKDKLFAWDETSEIQELKNLPVVPSSSVDAPSERADDIVQFIEEAMAMKVPEPPTPSPHDDGSTTSPKASGGRMQPTHRRIEGISSRTDTSQKPVFNKCGRCRTIIDNDTGCVQCRRAQLVINMSKRQPGVSSKAKGEGDNKLLKVHTAMLGRVQMKEGSGDTQLPGDQAVSNAIMKTRWTPCAILPPQSFATPSKREYHDYDEETEGSEESSQQSLVSKDEVLVLNPTEEERFAMAALDAVDIGQEQDEYSEEVDGKRPRSKRLKAVASQTGRKETWAASDRQKLFEQHKREASELHKRTTSIACCGILLALMRRDPLLLFAEPVTAEGYATIVKNPIDFGKIRSNVLGGTYQTLGVFTSDAWLLCENALAYNPPGSIYFKTAKELHEILAVMQKRSSDWMRAIKDAHASFLLSVQAQKRNAGSMTEDEADTNSIDEDPFSALRKRWPGAVDMLEDGDWLRAQVEADFMRTKENEPAYYGSLAVRRVAAAAEASLAPYTDAGGIHSVVAKRSHIEDNALRRAVDVKVAQHDQPPQLKDVTTWREESVVRFMRKVQSRRLERRIVSGNGCARCDGLSLDQEMKAAMNGDAVHWGKSRKKGESDLPRVDASRVDLTTGLASGNAREQIEKRQGISFEAACETVNDACVSVRGSRIHGWGLYADQPFGKGAVVAEYIGEYVGNPVADAREKHYREQRIQDYQFRLDDKNVIDATMKGGLGRYINHNCSPNCVAKIIPGEASTDTHLKRVIIIAQRDIDFNEEITYDYQFPLELNLAARVPCSCQSEACRGFMNWDLPEKGSNNRALLVQKRGANMRDRIRRLGRPLKRDDA